MRDSSSLRSTRFLGSTTVLTQPEKKLVGFDDQTYKQLQDMQQRQVQECRALRMRCALRDVPKMSKADVMHIRNPSERAIAQRTNERIAYAGHRQRASLREKHKSETRRFMDAKTEERAALSAESYASHLPKTARQRLMARDMRCHSSFKTGRKQFIDDDGLNFGRFRKKKKLLKKESVGDLLNADHLDKVLETVDSQYERHREEREMEERYGMKLDGELTKSLTLFA